MHLAILTSGGAGMFCGSCMHDNTWARALAARGVEVSLVPTYTPIRLDEADASRADVYLGGINVYLDQRVPLWGRLPRFLVGWLDSPAILRLASRIGVSNDARKLGELTLGLLDGESGPQHREIDRLVGFLCDELRPDAVVFSNALIVGALRSLRKRFAGRILCTLQGDDVFLESLPEPYRTGALDRIRERARDFDAFLVHSDYYRDFMADYFAQPPVKFFRLPLGIDLSGHDGTPRPADPDRFTVGFFARVCPEKGFHVAVEALRLLRSRHPHARLRAGGYLGPRDEPFFRRTLEAARDLGDSVAYVGSPATHAEKVALFRSFDVFSVPTTYREPKGLPVLEALANGVPVVQPRHGAFPEMLARTGGGLLVDPDDPAALAAAWERLLLDPQQRLELARAGHAGVRAAFGDQALADATLDVLARLGSSASSA